MILASNRDEFLNRPTERAHFWHEYPHVLGGIDLGTLLKDDEKPQQNKSLSNKPIQETHLNKETKTCSAISSASALSRSLPTSRINTQDPLQIQISQEDQDDLLHTSHHNHENHSKNERQTETRSQNESTELEKEKDEETWIGHGTWLGMTLHGKFSAVTNYREHPSTWLTDARSRGYLVRDFLYHPSISVHDYVERLKKEACFRYNGFNLVVGEIDGSWYLVSNRSQLDLKDFGNVVGEDGEDTYIGSEDANIGQDDSKGRTAYVQELNPCQVYGVSNGYFEEHHHWPKVYRGSKLFEQVIQKSQTKEELIESLLEVLKNTQDVPEKDLPPNMYDYNLEKMLSPICINKERCQFPTHYATKTHTIILVDQSNQVTFIEQDRYTQVQNGFILREDTKRFEFELKKKNLGK